MSMHKNFVCYNRDQNRNSKKKLRVLSREEHYNSIRGLKYDTPNPETCNLLESTVTSRELMLKKWKAEKELKNKKQDLKKPAFVVRTASKIPSTLSVKVNRSSSLQDTSSFMKKTLPFKTCEKNIVNAPKDIVNAPKDIVNAPSVLSKKTNPKIAITLTEATLPAKKCQENILHVPTSLKTIPKVLKQSNLPVMKMSSTSNNPNKKVLKQSNLPVMKMSSTSNVVSTSAVKPSKLPEKNKVIFSNIPKTNFYKTVPRLFLFGNKNTEKYRNKSTIKQSCKKELIDIMKDSESQIQTPTSLLYTKILTTDNTPRRSQRLKEKIYSHENLQSMARPSEIKLVDIGSSKDENTQMENKIHSSERHTKKCERKDSYDDLLNMPRPSGMELVDIDDSPIATGSTVSYDFDNLHYEDHMFEEKNEKNVKKVSLLYDPKRRQTRYSIKGDLMFFSPPK